MKQSDEIIFRKMTERDIDPYCILFQHVFSNPPWNEKWTFAKVKSITEKLIHKKGFTGITAENNTNNIGYLTGFSPAFIPSIYYIDQLFVALESHGKGIGKNLLLKTTGLIKDIGVSVIFLLTKPCTAAEKFYLNNGYKRFLPVLNINGKGIYYKKI
jgi:aminoglycoside 6'-N-acetyltransferase I